MVPSDKGAPRKAGLPNWLIFGVLGLVATAGGLFLPQGFKHGAAATEATVAPTETKKAKDPLDYQPPELPDMPSPGAMFTRLGLGTVFVLLLSVVTLWAGKRWIRPLAGPTGENKQLRVLEALALGGRCSVYLLQAGEAKVLAGVDHAGIKALLPLPQPFEGTLTELSERAGTEAA